MFQDWNTHKTHGKEGFVVLHTAVSVEPKTVSGT